ncbi:MAG: PHD finger protein 14 [Paramarteilia canceri]
MVHEVCYGIIDNNLEADNLTPKNSLSQEEEVGNEIEYWFCDECKVEKSELENDDDIQKSQSCELCPKINVGPLKETEHNEWVHMLCALYTPNVQFHFTDNMSCITLSELDFSNWGEKPCQVCIEEQQNQAWSGLSIKCASINCSKHYHATCHKLQQMFEAKLKDTTNIENMESSQNISNALSNIHVECQVSPENFHSNLQYLTKIVKEIENVQESNKERCEELEQKLKKEVKKSQDISGSQEKIKELQQQLANKIESAISEGLLDRSLENYSLDQLKSMIHSRSSSNTNHQLCQFCSQFGIECLMAKCNQCQKHFGHLQCARDCGADQIKLCQNCVLSPPGLTVDL